MIPVTDQDPTTTLWLAGELTRADATGEWPVDTAQRIVAHLAAARVLVDPTTAVPLWRCTTCGKWSHAKRRPNRHQRWVTTGTTTAAWAGDPFAGPAGEFQPCGPFQEWTATPARRPEGTSA